MVENNSANANRANGGIKLVAHDDEDDDNLLEQMFFDSTANGADPVLQSKGGKQQRHIPERSAFENAGSRSDQSSSSDSDSDDSADSDSSASDGDGAQQQSGEAAICDACGKSVLLTKLEQHISYFCQNQLAECPMCFLELPSGQMQEHIAGCELAVVDPEIVTCKYCKVRMRRDELKDHAIAHLIEQKQVENQVVQRVAEINEFFEEEKLEVASNRAPPLRKEQLRDLPVTVYNAKPS